MHSMHEPEAMVPNGLALVSVVTTQIVGIVLINRDQAAVLTAGTLSTAHGKVTAAYLIHECAHAPPFRAPALSRWVDEPTAWIAGASAAGGEKIIAAICSTLAAALQKEFFA